MEHPLWSVLNFIFLQQAIEPTGASAPRGVQSLIVSSGQTCYKIEIQNNLIITRTTKKTRKPSRKGSGYLVMKKSLMGTFRASAMRPRTVMVRCLFLLSFSISVIYSRDISVISANFC